MTCPFCGAAVGNAATCPLCGANLAAPPTSPALPAGTRLLRGKYTLGKVLGQGGFGITYMGADTALNRPVAIKELFPQGCQRNGTIVQPAQISPADFADMKHRFLDEARLLASFSHSGIVRVYEVFEENNTAYMVMEFLRGRSLAQLVEERGGALGEQEAVEYILKVCEALDVVHQRGYLHRDIKPANIILCEDGRVILIDFGAARAYTAGKRMTVMLTPGFAPLEQYAKQARWGVYTDIYALGATLYYLLTGVVPVSAEYRNAGVELRSVRELNGGVSEQVDEAVMRALAMRVDDRPQSVGEFLRALQGSSLTPVQPPIPIPPVSSSRDCRRRLGEKMGAVTCALSGAIGGLGLGIAIGLLLIAFGAVLGAIVGAVIGIKASMAVNGSNGRPDLLSGLIIGGILGYFIGLFAAVISAVGGSIGALAVGGYRGMQFGMQLGGDWSERYGLVPTSLLLCTTTGVVIGLVWAGLVLHVQSAEWTEAAAFVGLTTAIGSMIGSVVGFLGFQYVAKQQGTPIASSERVTALVTFPIGLLLVGLLINIVPYSERWWDVESTWRLLREKVEEQIRRKLPFQESSKSTETSAKLSYTLYTPPLQGKSWYVQAEQANFRSSSCTHFDVICILGKNTEVRGVGVSADEGWAEVVFESGTAIAENAKQIVEGVRLRENYLACNPETRSEVVLLIDHPETGAIIGQTAVGSSEADAFDQSNEAFLPAIAQQITALQLFPIRGGMLAAINLREQDNTLVIAEARGGICSCYGVSQ